MYKYKCLVILVLASFTACTAPLYSAGPSTTSIQSAQSPDVPVPDIHKMYVLVNVGASAGAMMLPLGTMYMMGNDFHDTMVREADICHVQATSSYVERWKIMKAHPILTPAEESEIMKTDHDKIIDFNPDVVLTLSSTTQTMQTQYGRTTLTNYAYIASLDIYPSGKAVWKAIIDMHPGQSQDNGSPSVVLARDVITKLAKDGILKDCPSKQVYQP